MAIEMSPKEFQKFQRELKKKKLKQEAEEVGLPGLDETITSLEKRVEKLEHLLKTAQSQSQKAYAKCLELQGIIQGGK